MIENIFHQDVLDIHPYIPGKPIEVTARECGIPADQIIKLASNENPLGPSPKAIEAVKTAADQVHFYPGDREYDLKEALAQKVGVKKENIILGNGSSEVICMIANAFARNKRKVVASKGSFIMYKLSTQYAGGTFIEVPLTADFKHDLPSIKKVILEEKPTVVFLDSPINPTGTICTSKEVQAFMEGIPEDVLIVFDEAYYDYAAEDPNYPRTLELFGNQENVVVLRSFSKIYGLAGLCCGYGLAHPKVTAYLEHVRAPFNVSLPAMEAAHAALEDQEHVQKTIALNTEGIKFLTESLEDLGLQVAAAHGNFVFVDTGRPGEEVFEAMQKEGVIVRPLLGYGFPTHVRISTGTAEQNQRCIEVLKKVLV